MRNRGPGKWREWRWGGTVVPLYPLEGTPAADPLDPSTAKPLSEIAHLTITKLTAKNCQAKLTDGIAELVKTPDSPGGRFNENRLRQLFKETAVANLTTEALFFTCLWPLNHPVAVAPDDPASPPGRRARTR
eukprot:symbB.v1.2.010453.t1/scaffold669.1/size295035/4